MAGERLGAAAASGAAAAAAVRARRRKRAREASMRRAAGPADPREAAGGAGSAGGAAEEGARRTWANPEAALGAALAAALATGAAAVLAAGGAAALRPLIRRRRRAAVEPEDGRPAGRLLGQEGTEPASGGAARNALRAHWFQQVELAHSARGQSRGSGAGRFGGGGSGIGMGVGALLPVSATTGWAGPYTESTWRVPAVLALAAVSLAAVSHTADPSSFPSLQKSRVSPALGAQLCALLLLWYLLIDRLVRHVSRNPPAPASRQRSRAASGVTAAPEPAGTPPAAVGVHPEGVQGRWLKDRAASDNMDGACDIVHMNFLVRNGVRLVKGMAFKCEPSLLCLQVFSEVPLLKIRERFTLVPGEMSQNLRRDMRRGGVLNWGFPRGTHYELHYEWGAPYGGSGTDLVVPIGPLELHIYSLVASGGRTELFRQVFRRKEANGQRGG